MGTKLLGIWIAHNGAALVWHLQCLPSCDRQKRTFLWPTPLDTASNEAEAELSSSNENLKFSCRYCDRNRYILGNISGELDLRLRSEAIALLPPALKCIDFDRTRLLLPFTTGILLCRNSIVLMFKLTLLW
ncbi:MAG: hypothetical protein F6K28_41630 [Microcoleus sp. SIO2G3]|nr:hypothetical protein [Microcoleus sp. SIO2G3]